MKYIPSDGLSGMPFLQPMKSDECCLQKKRIAILPSGNPVGSDSKI